MPIELGIWRIDQGLESVAVHGLDLEERLEGLLDSDISIASPNWMVIGRQVATGLGGIVDLLGIDPDGNLVVLELKRDKTPRDVVAQVLDYGSWVVNLTDSDVAEIFEKYLERYHPDQRGESLDAAFCARFGLKTMPDALNASHQLVVVAGSLDSSTERILTYLAEQYGVSVNAIFFRAFKDGDREYLSRVWFIDPATTAVTTGPVSSKEPWNGEFYVSFGEGPHRHWGDAAKYGFISAGHGPWYSRTLHQLEPGSRIWVNVPGEGYVGVGKVLEPAVRADKFTVNHQGKQVALHKLEVKPAEMFDQMDNDDMAEYIVRVEWIKTRPLNKAIREKGFFGNQHSACKPTAKSWVHTIDRLKQKFGVE
jgi:hypothetical protein